MYSATLVPARRCGRRRVGCVQEAEAVTDLVKSLLCDQVRVPTDQEAVTAAHVGVICMSRAQAICVRNLLRKEGLHDVNVGTVDDFQGQEMRVTFITTVLTKPVRPKPPPAVASDFFPAYTAGRCLPQFA